MRRDTVLGTVAAAALTLAAAGCGGATTGAAGTPTPSEAPAAGVTIFDETSVFDPAKSTEDASAQYEIVTPTGRHVYVDVVSFAAAAKQPGPEDVLLITHGHPDHLGNGVMTGFPGQQIVMKASSLVLPDVTVTSTLAAHNAGEAATAGDDTIFVIDTGGVRIAHFGDIGQNALTPEQQAVVGRPDIMFSQLENEVSGMGADSTAGFDLVKQVNPRVFVPTHLWGDKAMAKKAATTWPAVSTTESSVHLDPGTLPEATTVLFSGLNAREFAKALKLPAATWSPTPAAS